MTTFERVDRRLLTWPGGFLLILMAAGAAAVLVRLLSGLGASTNLSDTWPWGLWKAFNVLALIALGAGGFTSAGLIYIFGGERYHGFARSAVLWAFLAYSFAGLSLAVDIGIPWRIVNPIFMWQPESLLFEVAWCVILYLTVLALEFAPALFGRFGWQRLVVVWRKLSPVYSVAALTFFTFLLTHSLIWAGAALALFGFLAFLFAARIKRPSTPVLLVMFGIILSTLHQSTLGSLFLLIPDKLSHLWWSPRLPLHFFFSAVAIGLSVILIERSLAPKLLGRQRQDDRLQSLSAILAVAVWLVLLLRIADLALVASGDDPARSWGSTGQAILFGCEVLIGLLLPAVILSSRRARRHAGTRILAASMIVCGGIVNRLSVGFLGLTLPGRYVPSLIELAVTLATLAAMVFFFSLGVKLLPVYDRDG